MTTRTVPSAALRWHRPLIVLTVAMAGLALVTAVGVVADPRILLGAPIWLKPFKFAVSFVLYGLTLAWMLSVLPRRSRVAEWAGLVVVAVAVIEMTVIVVQAGRGITSHFNQSTPLNATLWAAMGMSIMVLFLAHLVIGVIALIQRIPDRPTRYAIRLGLALSLLGLLAAAPMVYPMMGTTGAGHSVGVPDGGPGLPFAGWSTVGGDLRIGHFVGLHGLQALPLLGFLLARYGRRLDEATRARLLLVSGGAYGVLVVLLTGQALRAQPLLRPDAVTLAGWVALALVTAVATASVLRADRPTPIPAGRA
jgi:hypothetical protein